MPPAASLRGRLRLPRHRNPFRRFLRRWRDDRKLDADSGSHVSILLPLDPTLMLLQDALACAQSQAGESLVVFAFGRVSGLVFGWAPNGAGAGNGDDGHV